MGNGLSHSYVRAKFPLVKTDTKVNTMRNRSEVEPSVQLLAILLDGLIEELEDMNDCSKDLEILTEMRRELATTGGIREGMRLKLNPELTRYLEAAATRALERNDYGAGKSFSNEVISLASELTNSSGTRSENRRLSVSFCGDVRVREYAEVEQVDANSLNRSFAHRLGQFRTKLSKRKVPYAA